MKKALIYLFVFCCLQVFAGILLAVIKGILSINAEDAETTLIALSSALSSVIAFGIFHARKWCPMSMQYLRSKPYEVLLIAAVAAIAALCPLTFLEELLPGIMTTNNMETIFDNLMTSPMGFVCITLAAPVAEEIVFRGAILRVLMPQYGTRALVISALMFSLIHMNPAQMPHAFVIGIFLGWMYQRTGSIIPGIVYHWVNNTMAFVIGWANPELSMSSELIDIFQGNGALMYSVIAISTILLICAIMRLNRIMKTAITD